MVSVRDQTIYEVMAHVRAAASVLSSKYEVQCSSQSCLVRDLETGAMVATNLSAPGAYAKMEELVLVRAFKLALTNVAKHAGTTEADLLSRMAPGDGRNRD